MQVILVKAIELKLVCIHALKPTLKYVKVFGRNNLCLEFR